MPRRFCILVAAAAVAALFVAPTAARADWGAISINEATRHASISYDYGTQAGAKIRSQAECGSGCHVAVWVRNGYGVLVKTRGGRYIAGLSHRTRSAAIRMARRRAHQPTAPLFAWVFSG